MNHLFNRRQLMSWLEKRFQLSERKSDVSTEARGALATFLTMSYILFANPAILSAAGVPFQSAVACTAAAAAICCIMMGVYSNYPVALASGMGINAFVAYHVAKAAGSWETAMGVVVLDGIIILILVLLGIREAVIDAIPRELRIAIGAGIGLFIAFIGLLDARLVVVPAGTLVTLIKNPNAVMPPVTYGSLRAPDTAIALIGLIVTAFLIVRKSKGALILGILFSTIIALIAGVTKLPTQIGWPSFEIAFKADLIGAFKYSLIPLLLGLIMVDFFDTLGTVTAIAEEGNLHDENGRIPMIRRILVVDSIAAAIGGLFGVSSVTSYVESAAGVAEGARTGLHTVFVGLLFLLAIIAAPIASVVPPAATAPALIMVGFLMAAQITQINFKDMETGIPAFITLITLPLTYSISYGIGYGFISYVLIKLLNRKAKEVRPLMYIVSIAFAAYFIFIPG
jgi:AGZA family xanthine/uracil permease-like MFS transporter